MSERRQFLAGLACLFPTFKAVDGHLVSVPREQESCPYCGVNYCPGEGHMVQIRKFRTCFTVIEEFAQKNLKGEILP